MKRRAARGEAGGTARVFSVFIFALTTLTAAKPSYAQTSSAAANAAPPPETFACGDAASDACVRLAQKTLDGAGQDPSAPRDVVLAAKLAGRACDNGGVRDSATPISKWGCQILARVYENYPAFIGDEKKSADLLEVQRNFCDRGVMTACVNISFAHVHGVGWKREDTAAQHFYKMACNHGFAPACVTARALAIVSPVSMLPDSVPEMWSPPTVIGESEKNWSVDQLNGAMIALEKCGAGNTDECAAASRFYFPADPASFKCERPHFSDTGPAPFPDPETALRIASHDCPQNDQSKCAVAKRRIKAREPYDNPAECRKPDPKSNLTPSSAQDHAPAPFFPTPTFLSLGPIATLANPDARGTIGGEVSLVRWLDDEPGGFGVGGYAQAEYVAGGTGRASLGLEGDYSGLGVEVGYAYQRLLEDKLNQSSVQVTPFLSLGIAHVGFRMLVPLTPTGAPVGMLVLGLKAPFNVGAPVRFAPTHWLGD